MDNTVLSTDCTAAAGGQGENTGEMTTTPADAGQDTSGEMTTIPADAGQVDSGEDSIASADAGQEERESVEARYRRLMDGEFKQLYTRDTQRMINARFRQTKQLEEQLGRARPILDRLARHFQVDGEDLEGLGRAMDRAGEEQRDRAEQQRRQRAEEQFRSWADQARQLRELYPDFDLQGELADDRFRALIANPKAPVPLRQAYEAIHMDRIKDGIARQLARDTQKQVVDSIRAKGARPQENGTAAQSAFQMRQDVGRLSGRELADLNRRILEGERISFG